jgi:chaperonin GroES
MKIKPLRDKVLVKPLTEDEKTRGGIIIPDTVKEKPQKGKVVAVGPGKKNKNGERIDVDVNEGDEILYSKYGGTEITLDEEEYLIMGEDDILGIISGGKM